MSNQAEQPPFIRFQRPTMPSAVRIARYFDLSREERWFSNGGPCWRLLRERLSDRVGAYCVPVASGTAGLLAALVAVSPECRGFDGVASGLMPSFTFPATAQAALWAGLTPTFIDIDPDSWHLDPSRLEHLLSEAGRSASVGAVLAVSSFGTPPPVETRLRWEQACRSADVPLVIDSAAGFGASAADGTPVGAQGDIEVVSFHATKPFAVGEGGAVFTRSRELRDRVETTINFGMGTDRSVEISRGINGKMSELHAATALAVLDELDSILAIRRRDASTVRARADSRVSWQVGCEHSTWQFIPVAMPSHDARQRTGGSIASRVEFRTYYEPLHAGGAFSRCPTDGTLRQTTELHKRVLCLPMANDLTEVELQTIGDALNGAEFDPR